MVLQPNISNNSGNRGGVSHNPPNSPASSPATTYPAVATHPNPAGVEAKLTVGPHIKLKGLEITDCDTLVVDGSVEATMVSRIIQISERGVFKGSAEIDIAEIHGIFEGSLIVREKLVIYATGKVTGRIRYRKVVIEQGGQLCGEIACEVPPHSQRQPCRSADVVRRRRRHQVISLLNRSLRKL